MNMKRLLRLKWMQFCNLIKFSQPTPQTTLQDKAIAVAGRVTIKKDGEHSMVFCPVCLDVIRTPLDSDMKMTLAVHLSLWHPDDVKLQWEVMQNKKQSNLHLPSIVLGVGIAAGIGALLFLSTKNHSRRLPVKGHAAPLIKLSHQMIKFGSKVTFLTTEFLHARLAEATANSEIRLLSIPDGLELEDDRKDQKKLHQSIEKVVPPYLEDLLKESFNQQNNDKISGIIIDSPLAWMLEIPKKMGIKTAIYWCSTPGCLALGLMIPHLLQLKIIDDDGTSLKNEKIQLLPNMPAITMSEFTWYFPGDKNIQKSLFHVIKGVFSHLKSSDWIICNWFHELDPSAGSLASNILSVGPLLANGQSAGSFCIEDSSCLTWLDKQSPNSVIYVAFGSTSRFSQVQLNELAMGLELMGRPFLWVAWSGLCDGPFPAFSDEFSARVANRGKMVEWAPQELVLCHPSIACFVTHCGWSSFMESLSMGVPLLCWPYFGDQMYTQSCICEAWKVGTSLEVDEIGVISRSEIKHKVEKLISDEIVRENVIRLKEMARKSISKGGSSWSNLEYLVQQMK